MMEIGAAYYPEQWDLERVKQDAELMRDAGLTFVRIGEFAWSRLEPQEGDFQFGHMQEAMRILGGHGIKVILCTPGATAPAWLVRKHPEILIKRSDGRRAYFGIRQHTCYHSPVYRKYLERIDEEIAKAFLRFDNILGFQIDNEIGHTLFGLCHCDACQEGFRQWLRKRYNTVQALNQAWGNGFWSQDYADWSEIELGNMDMTEGSSHVQDSIRFHSDRKCDYIACQVRILRKYYPNHTIATNTPAGTTDRHASYALVDRAGLDCYPMSDEDKNVGAPADLYAGMKPGVPFWVLETGIGGYRSQGVPHCTRLSAHLWSFLALGAELISIFWWRNALSGYEKNLVGILGHNGEPRWRYELIRNWIKEMRKVLDLAGELPLPVPDAGIVFDHENHWGYASGHWRLWGEYETGVTEMHTACEHLHIHTNTIPPDCDFSRYKLLLLSSQLHVGSEMAEQIRKFVADGGIVIGMGQTGTQDSNSKFLPESGPRGLRDVFGLSLEDCVPSAAVLPQSGEKADPELHVMFSGAIGGNSFTGFASGTLVDAKELDAEVLARFDNTDLVGFPAVTMKSYGKGFAFHINANRIDPESLKRIVAYAAKSAGIQMPRLPEDVKFVRRGDLTFLINLGKKEQQLNYGSPDSALLLGERRDGKIILPGYGTCVLKG